MRTYELTETFSIDAIQAQSRDIPRAQPYEVVLKMKAACLNYRDLLVAEGKYNPRQPLPLIPLSDGVGEVVEVGADVTAFKVGDRLCPTFSQGWMAGRPEKSDLRQTLGSPLNGVLAEYAKFDARGLVKIPEYLSDEAAATLPCAALTAWSALHSHTPLKSGETLLLQGTGGVSIFALQFAKLAGAQVILTSSRDEKRQRAEGMGADFTLNYRVDENWGKSAKKWTGGRGVDQIIEVGGAGTLSQSLKAIAPGGRISLIGILAGASKPLNILPILMNQITVQGVMVGHKRGFEAMLRAMAAVEMQPVIDRIFPVEDISAAFAYLKSGAHFGKICLRWP